MGNDLPAAAQGRAALPRPLRKTASVQECGAAFERGIERRARRINVPAWVGALRWLKPLLPARLVERVGGRTTRRWLPEMDAEVGELGRSLSARTQALGEDR